MSLARYEWLVRLSNCAIEVKSLIKNEVLAVLNLLSPLVTPLIDFVLKLSVTLEQDTDLAADLKGLASGLENVLGGLLDPVGDLLKVLSS